MNKRALWLAIAACFAGATFVTQADSPAPPPPPPTKICTKAAKCELFVSVKACSANGISIDHMVVGVKDGEKDVDIDWTLDKASEGSYEFHKTNGIKPKRPGWEKEFGSAQGNKNTFRWHDRNHLGTPKKRVYEYSITVVKKDGSPCGVLDPIVINDS